MINIDSTNSVCEHPRSRQHDPTPGQNNVPDYYSHRMTLDYRIGRMLHRIVSLIHLFLGFQFTNFWLELR
jgi:hypothetical protein